MTTIAIRLDPRQLANPDLDIRYRLPDLLAQRCSSIESDGYDYRGEPPYLVLFLKTPDLERALACVLDVIENVRVLDNDLRSVVVAVQHGVGKQVVVYPGSFAGEFLPA